MNQNIMQSQNYLCFKCGYQQANIGQTVCPLCGGKMKTRMQIRILGLFLTLLSGFLLVFMSFISSFVYNATQQSDKSNIGAKFTGSKNDLMMIIAVFGFVFLFGVVGLITGLWQLILGRRNKILAYTILLLGAVFVVGGLIFQFYFGK